MLVLMVIGWLLFFLKNIAGSLHLPSKIFAITKNKMFILMSKAGRCIKIYRGLSIHTVYENSSLLLLNFMSILMFFMSPPLSCHHFFSLCFEILSWYFGMWVYNDKLQIKFTFHSGPMIFGRVMALGPWNLAKYLVVTTFFRYAWRYWLDFWYMSI